MMKGVVYTMTSEKTLRELCEAYHISRRAVQGYEQQGLVQPTGRTKMGHLLYDEAAQAQVLRIHRYQQYGFRLKEIHNLLSASPALLCQRLQQQLLELEQRRTELDSVIYRLSEEIHGLKQPQESILEENEL